MKEVTEWSGKPRWMWCWDSDKKHKVKEYVVYIFSKEELKNIRGTEFLPVCTHEINYEHCAEIEEETTKRLTNYELSQLLKCFWVDYIWGAMNSSHNEVYVDLEHENKEVPEDYKIRYMQGKWEEPTRETVMKWSYDDEYDTDIGRFVDFIGWDKE